MNVTAQILDALREGEKPSVVARRYPWNTLSERDRRALLTMAEKLENQTQSHDLLLYLFFACHHDETRVKILSLATENTTFSLQDRESALRSLARVLEHIEHHAARSRRDKNRLQGLQSDQARFYWLAGQLDQETGRKEQALAHYQMSLQIYQRIGSRLSADRVEKAIRQLTISTQQELQAPEQPTLTPEQAAELSSASQQLEDLETKIHQKEEELQRLIDRVAALREENTWLSENIAELKSEVQKLIIELDYTTQKRDLIAQELDHYEKIQQTFIGQTVLPSISLPAKKIDGT